MYNLCVSLSYIGLTGFKRSRTDDKTRYKICRVMASDLLSLVFKLSVLSSCMLVGGQSCSITGTMRYLYVIVCGFQRSLDWTTGIPTGMYYSIVVQLKFIQFAPAPAIYGIKPFPT